MPDDGMRLEILAERVKSLDSRVDRSQARLDSSDKSITILSVKHEELERRHVSHNARLDAKIDNHYTILGNDIKGLKDGLSSFKSEVLKQLDKNSGRDAVLKILLTGGVATLLIKNFLEL